MLSVVKTLALILPVLLAGCLDYEIKVETVISVDGTATRVVRIKERSDKKATWRRYAPPTLRSPNSSRS